LGYTVTFDETNLERYIINATLHPLSDSEQKEEIPVLIDTGAFNNMIDIDLVEGFGHFIPVYISVTMGGEKGRTDGCILPKVQIGDLVMTNVFAMAFPLGDWLKGHMVLGANALNNWDFTISRTNGTIMFCENVPKDAPNKANPYQNYFKNGKYMALQKEQFPGLGGV